MNNFLRPRYKKVNFFKKTPNKWLEASRRWKNCSQGKIWTLSSHVSEDNQFIKHSRNIWVEEGAGFLRKYVKFPIEKSSYILKRNQFNQILIVSFERQYAWKNLTTQEKTKTPGSIFEKNFRKWFCDYPITILKIKNYPRTSTNLVTNLKLRYRSHKTKKSQSFPFYDLAQDIPAVDNSFQRPIESSVGDEFNITIVKL